MIEQGEISKLRRRERKGDWNEMSRKKRDQREMSGKEREIGERIIARERGSETESTIGER